MPRAVHQRIAPPSFSTMTKAETHARYHRTARDLLSIHPYNHTMTPMNPSTPSHGANAKSSGTSAIGASLEKPTMSPAFSTPQMLSPTINPDATSVPNRSARSGFGVDFTFPSYQCASTAPTITAKVADIGR